MANYLKFTLDRSNPEGLWMYQTYSPIQVPLPGEKVNIQGNWYTVIDREWFADFAGMHAVVRVEPTGI